MTIESLERINNLIKNTLNNIDLFTDEEIEKLNSLKKLYKEKTERFAEPEYKKGLERLAIDLSWKSSQIEVNISEFEKIFISQFEFAVATYF